MTVAPFAAADGPPSTPLLSGFVALLLAFVAPGASAQGWSAQLVLSPLPSPFLSDWEVDPSIGELIVTNSTGTTSNVTFHYTLTRNGQPMLRGATDPQRVPSGQPVVFNAATTFGGRADWDRGVQDLVARTGRLPEGEYEGCVTLAGSGGVVLVPRQCAKFTTQYPDPPFLVAPMSGDTVRSQDVIFQWQPVQISPLADARVAYVLQLAEVRTEAGQRPEVALQSNISHYIQPNLIETSHQYPVGAQPLVSGRTYAWRVQALDGTGRPVAANQGRSEIWTFVYREPETETRTKIARIALEARRDTLRFAGDTTRFEARAYDADNVEIHGKRMRWRSIDTAVARVDSTGVVTAVAAGRTPIVASADGVADSAFSVMAPGKLSLRFASYDPATEAPSLLELIKSGTFEEVAPKLMALLQSGEFVIPVPRLPGLAGGQAREQDNENRDGGPSVSGTPVLQAAADACPAIEPSVVSAELDTVKKVFAIRFGGVTEFGNCLRLPPTDGQEPETEVDTTFHRSAVFVYSMTHPGLPRVFLALKGIGQLPLPLGGTTVHVRYLVVNFIRTVTVEADALPKRYAGFFGSDSFDAGVGVTLYSQRRCPKDSTTELCLVLNTINPDSPDITVQAFAGVTAAEVSAGAGVVEGKVRPQVGASVALGFSIAATLPVGRLNIAVGDGGFSIDSLQVGLLFAVQDSMVNATQMEARDLKSDNLSIGVAVTLVTWLTGSRGNSWEIDGSVGVEWDPRKTYEALGETGEERKTKLVDALKPKLVLSAQLAQVWKLGVIRLGNPQIVFTTPIGSREEREATTVALSGTWGFGKPEGIGVVPGGGDVKGDAGGAATGAATGFESFGRGQVTFELKRPELGPPPASAKEARDSATVAVTRQLHVVRDARKRVEDARKADIGAREAARDAERRGVVQQSKPQPGLAPPPSSQPPAAGTLAAAERDLAIAEAELQRMRGEREAARKAVVPTPVKCRTTVRGRCLTWTASLSVGTGAFSDLLALILRASTGSP